MSVRRLPPRFAVVEDATQQRRGPEYLASIVVSEIERWSGPIRAGGAAMD
jgi:hypothetical protein